MPAATGHHIRAAFDWEAVPSFGTGTVSGAANPKTFGADVTFDTLEGSHNAVRVFDPNSRQAARIIEQAFDGALTIGFTVTNPWAIGGAIDASVTSTSMAPSIHTWDPDSGAGYPKPMVVYEGVDLDSNGYERDFRGFVPANLTVNIGVGNNVTATIDGAYADEGKSDTLTNAVATSFRPFHFGGVDFVYDVDGSQTGSISRTRVQEATINISQNVDMIQELGTRFPVTFSPKILAPDLDYTRITDDTENPDDEVDRFYGSTSSQPSEPQETITNAVNYDVTLDNNIAATDNSMTFGFEGGIPDTFTNTGAGDPEADFEQELQEMVETVQLQATLDQTPQ